MTYTQSIQRIEELEEQVEALTAENKSLNNLLESIHGIEQQTLTDLQSGKKMAVSVGFSVGVVDPDDCVLGNNTYLYNSENFCNGGGI